VVEHLRELLVDRGFEIGLIDPTIFTKKVNGEIFICQLYVDNIIFGSSNKSFNDEFARLMTNKFEMSMMGELKFFLGFELRQLRGGTFINQAKYTQDMLKKFKMDSGVKGAKTPMPTKVALDLDPSGKEVDQKLYHSMIGSLLYLCASRLDIMLNVGMCAQYQPAPKESHLMAVKRVFRIQIGRETKWIGSQLSRLANFLVGLWLVGLPRSKIVCLSPLPKPSMWRPQVVVLNFFG
jgi:hypothetical protein